MPRRAPAERPAEDDLGPAGEAGWRAALNGCRRCPLYANATQGVPGDGPAGAALMLVGEQPGDQEDLAGRAFVGPAGQLLWRVLAEVGLERGQLYVTNAVKHFKFQPRGKRRLHQRPNAGEIERCSWWIGLELRQVRPKLLVALGASAADSLTGSGAKLLARRGKVEEGRFGVPVFVSVHPSYLLRLRGDRAEAEAQFRDDMRKAGRLAGA